MSLVKWRRAEICFAGKSVFTGPYEAEILLNQPRKKDVFFFFSVVVE